MNARNPYAPPKAELDTTPAGQCWRDGKTLMLSYGTALPQRCVKCNAAADTPIKKRTIYWHHPAWYLLIFVAILLYAIVAIIVRKKAQIQPGLCRQHTRRRTMGLSILWGGVVLGICFFFAGFSGYEILIPLGALVLLISIIWGGILSRILRPIHIDYDVIHLRGAGKAFLDSLPEVPGR